MFNFFQRRRNRRSGGRAGILDVKMRTRQMRVSRRRAAGMGLAGLAALGLFGLLFWRGGQWLLNNAVYENGSFAVQHVEISTDGVIAPAVLRRWAMVKPGENLLALDLMRIKRDLELHAAIQSVAVERELPGTLRLVVGERQPAAQTVAYEARKGGGFNRVTYDFDGAGFVMQPLDPAWRLTPEPTNDLLPMLAGVPMTELQPGRQAESPQIRAALRLIAEMDRSPMAGLAELQSINVAAADSLEATTTQGARITFAPDHFAEQLRRWRVIADQYQQWGKAIVSLDLSPANNLPVRWVASGVMPAPTHVYAKTIKPKKKNV